MFQMKWDLNDAAHSKDETGDRLRPMDGYLSLSHSLTLTLSVTLSLSHFLSLSLTHSHSLSLSHSLSHTLSLSSPHGRVESVHCLSGRNPTGPAPDCIQQSSLRWTFTSFRAKNKDPTGLLWASLCPEDYSLLRQAIGPARL